MEDYEKKYKEALEKARQLCSYPTTKPFISDLQDLFPELKESEDERIRGAIIDFFKYEQKEGIVIHHYGVNIERIIAWLEKQGEQYKVEPKFKHGDRVRNKKSGLEQTLGSCIEDIYEGAFPFCIKDQDDWELVEQKPAWSEEDGPLKELAETYLAVFDKKFPILPTLKGKQLADYKNFLNKCQQILGLKHWGIHPTQARLFEKLSLLWAAWGAEHLKGLGQTDGNTDNEKQEWSEEEIENCAREAEDNNCIILAKHIRQLKFLKPQSRWKPSEEQMDTLLSEVTAWTKGCPKQIVLESLYNDLKKL